MGVRASRGGCGGREVEPGMGWGWGWGAPVGPRPLLPSSPSLRRCDERGVACYCPLVFGAIVLKENKRRPERALP